MESAFILTMRVENTVEQLLNQGWSEEFRIVVNILMDKLEAGEITLQEYQDISVLWKLTELTERQEEENCLIESMDREGSLDVPDLYKYGVLEIKKSKKATESQDAVIHQVVESVRCSDFVFAEAKEKRRLCQTEVQLLNGDMKTAKMIWTMGKVPTGSVFDGGGGLVLDRQGDILKRGICSV